MNVANKYLPNYTYGDYSFWEGRWELIEGIPSSMMPRPVPIHQTINGNLYANFETALKKSCKSFRAYLPIDWKIKESTILQPDLLNSVSKNRKKVFRFFA